MALIKCADCGKEISDEAVVCPSCGKPNNETQKAEAEKEKRDREFRYEFGKKWDKYNFWSRCFLAGGFIIGLITQSLVLGFILVLIGMAIAIKFRLYRRSLNA